MKPSAKSPLLPILLLLAACAAATLLAVVVVRGAIPMAASGGHAWSQYALGRFYERGSFAYSQDSAIALSWYRKAAEQGHVKARHRAAKLGGAAPAPAANPPPDAAVTLVGLGLPASPAEYPELHLPPSSSPETSGARHELYDRKQQDFLEALAKAESQGKASPPWTPTLRKISARFRAEVTNEARLALHARRLGDADRHYTAALALAQISGDKKLRFTRQYETVAAFYRQGKRKDISDEIHQKILALRSQVLGPNAPMVGMSLRSIAMQAAQENRKEEALRIYLRSAAIFKKAGDKQLLMTNNMLASLYERMKRYTDARATYEENIALAKKFHGAGKPPHSQYLMNLADYLSRRGETAEAEALYKVGLAQAEKQIAAAANNTSLHFAIGNMSRYAYFLERQKRFDEVVTLREKIGALRERTASSRHFIAQDSFDLGRAYHGAGRPKAAEASYIRALAAYEAQFGAESSALSGVLRRYSELLDETGRKKQASKVRERADKISEKARRAYEKRTGRKLPRGFKKGKIRMIGAGG